MDGWRYPADVPGWLTEAEGRTLARLAIRQTVLEIGSWCGRSTICMAQTAAVVHAVDWHQGCDGVGEGPHWTLPEMMGHLDRYHLRDKVVIHFGRSEQVEKFFGEGVAGLAFVDGAHDYHSVLLDCRIARKCVHRGGVIAFHDWNRDFHPDVKQAVADELGWNDGNLVDSLMWRRVE